MFFVVEEKQLPKQTCFFCFVLLKLSFLINFMEVTAIILYIMI